MSLARFAYEIKEASEALAEVVSACQSLLWHSLEAKESLEYIKTRLSDKEIIDYNIGYFPPNNQLNILFNYIKEKTLIDLGLIWESRVAVRGSNVSIKRSLFHYHNLIFPLSDEYNNLISLTGRTILDKTRQKEIGIPKYKNTPFKKQLYLYGIDKAKYSIEEKNKVIIVEGQIDCIKCHSFNLKNTVALTGSEITLQQIFSLMRKTKNFYFILDPDSAGEKALNKIKRNYGSDINIFTIKLPSNYEDIDDYFMRSSDYSCLDTLLRGVNG